MNQLINSSLTSAQSLKPKVMSITRNNLKMGELTAANTKFELKAAPRVNRI